LTNNIQIPYYFRMVKKYQLFLSKECSDCEKLLNNKELPWLLIEKKWLDKGTNQKNFPIIVPALQKGDKLLAYGYDQISLVLNQKEHVYSSQFSKN
jgi:hypothetical protein